MATLVSESHHALHSIAEEVEKAHITSSRIQKIIKDMRAVLRSYKGGDFTGVAIAAPQIGISLRIFLIEDVSDSTHDTPTVPTLVAINPRLIKLSKQKSLMKEGCLSVDNRYGTVRRSLRATIRAYNADGTAYERGASGLLAQIFQHELDHLDGILFLDRAEHVHTKETDEDTPPSKKKKSKRPQNPSKK